MQCGGMIYLQVWNPYLAETESDQWKDDLVGKCMELIAEAAWNETDRPSIERLVLKKLRAFGKRLGIKVFSFKFTNYGTGKVYWINGGSDRVVFDFD